MHPDGIPELADLERPRLRPDVPLLWRTSTSVQIGEKVTLTSMTRALVAWMTSLDGTSGPQTIIESLTIPEVEARRLVRALRAAGALDDAARVPEQVRWAPPSDRPAAAARFAATIAAYQDLDRAHAAARQRDRCRIGIVGQSVLAEQLREALGLSDLLHDDTDPHLTVLTDAPHPDVPADFDHPAMSGPHLFVAAYGARAVVGPLVLPGRTGCLRCRHLHRRDADPSWPVVAVQWAHSIARLTAPPVDHLLCRIAADWAALLVRTWVDLPDAVDTWGGWSIDLALPLGDPHVRDCPPHPLCGCRWMLESAPS